MNWLGIFVAILLVVIVFVLAQWARAADERLVAKQGRLRARLAPEVFGLVALWRAMWSRPRRSATPKQGKGGRGNPPPA